MCQALQVSGKLPGRPPVAAAVGQNSTRLLYAWDRYSGRRFLVDTGAEVSVFPATRREKHPQSQGATLTAANGSSIRTYGKRSIPLKFDHRHFKWTFTIAQVSQPLLGADFLRAHSLLVDIKGRHVSSTPPTSRPSPFAAPLQQHPILAQLHPLMTSMQSCWLNSQTSQAPPSLTPPPSMGWSSSYPPKDHPSMHEHAGFHQTS